MTQEEIDKFLANTKVYVNGKSKEIQEKLFSLGYSWNNDSTGTDVCHTEAPFLFIYEDTSITMSSEMDVFCDHENSEITAEDILSLELTESAFRPFKSKEECWQEMLKHEPFGWLNGKTECLSVTSVSDVHIWLGDNVYFTFEDAFNEYTFSDGTPFGIKEE